MAPDAGRRTPEKNWRPAEAGCYGGPVPADRRGTVAKWHEPEVSSLMTVIALGAARTQKTINVTSVATG